MTRFTTGPVGQGPLNRPPAGGGGGGGGNQSIHAQPGDRFRWAYVINPDPLTIQFEDETTPLRGSPSTLIPKSGLMPYCKVWVQQHANADGVRNVVIGVGTGGNPWVNVPILDGFAARDDGDYAPQVMLDNSGLVDFRGQMANTGLSNPSGAATAILQLPDGYWPEAEVRWIGFTTQHPSTPYGGWISRVDGKLYIRNETDNANFPPTDHWCIIVQPWKPIPAQPY